MTERPTSVFGIGAVGGGLYVPAPRNSIFSAAADMATSRDQFEAILWNTSEYVAAIGRLISGEAKPTYLVVVTATDAVGLIARVCDPLAKLQCNVERAHAWSIVGRHVLMAEISTEPLRDELLQAGITQNDVEAALRRAGFAVREAPRPSQGTAHVVTLLPVTPAWRREGAVLCRYMANMSDAPGRLRSVTHILALKKAPILTFSAWVEESERGARCLSRFWFETEPEQVEAIERELRAKVAEDETGTGNLETDVRYSPAPPGRPAVDYEGRPTAFTVVGFARPGFIDTALGAVGGLNVTGASMAVLGAYTGLVLVVDVPEDRSPNQIQDAIEVQLHDFDAETAAPDLSTVLRSELQAVAELPTHVTATHTVTARGSNRPGVLASVANAARENQVNIVRMDAQVTADSDNPAHEFDVHLLVHVPEGRLEDFRASLQRRSDSELLHRFMLLESDEAPAQSDSTGRHSG